MNIERRTRSDSDAPVRQIAYPRTAVVIPIRSFVQGKSRLGASLSQTDRADLLRRMATGVVHAARDLPVMVVTSAPEVQDWAWDLGLGVIDDPGSLDDAAAAGAEWARSQLFGRVVFAHADLPLARTLGPVVTVHDTALATDLDTPADLAEFAESDIGAAPPWLGSGPADTWLTSRRHNDTSPHNDFAAGPLGKPAAMWFAYAAWAAGSAAGYRV